MNSRKNAFLSKSTSTRLLPLAFVVLGVGCFFAFGLHTYFSIDQLRDNREQLLAFSRDQRILAPVIFMLVYTIVTALSLPGALILSLVGGFMFGLLIGTISVIIGATCGAVILFAIVRFGFGDMLIKRAGSRIKTMEKGFQENAFQYLLILRLIPLFPFFVVNIVAGLLQVRTRSFVLATLIGIIPGTFAYVSVGNGIGAVFDAGSTPNLDLFSQTEVIIPIVVLTALALLQLVYKRYKKSQQ